MKAMPIEDLALAMRKEAEKWAFDGAKIPSVSRYKSHLEFL